MWITYVRSENTQNSCNNSRKTIVKINTHTTTLTNHNHTLKNYDFYYFLRTPQTKHICKSICYDFTSLCSGYIILLCSRWLYIYIYISASLIELHCGSNAFDDVTQHTDLLNRHYFKFEYAFYKFKKITNKPIYEEY